jgi:disulfide bond formation protein DsbB
MKYWERFFMTLGAGCLIGAIIQPTSWAVIPLGIAFTGYGWYLYKKGGEK